MTPNFSRRVLLKGLGIAALGLGLLQPLIAPASAQETLVINTDRSGAGQKAAMNKIAADFEAANPGVKVTVNYSDVESYKTSIRNFLVASPPDVAFWFTGARMRAFTKRDLFEDISGFYAKNGLDPSMAPFLPAVTDGGKQYMMPTNFNTWGFFYNKDVFAKLGVEPPKTWNELMAIAEKAKAAGIVPFTIGTRDLWANALWFDYLTKRINGLDFYMGLMDGKESYTDPRMTKVFDTWRVPIEKGYFLDNASSYGWQEAIPFLSQGKAAMYLLGPYVLTSLPEDARKNIGFFPFPTVDPSVPNFEQVSINGVGIPKGAKNKELALKFLAFLAQKENLLAFAKGGSVVPARVDIEIDPNDFASVQMQQVRNSSGSSQFYDRDTDPDMAQTGMKGFQEFLAKPDRQEAILQRLDAARKRVFN
ncbi:multiple sugar transport system substrate-binding protein [Ancylobacter sp. 3268]|uniref:ABC transporter substrate-binding protein n=1 Tax=Ancylobacter sp. 3268 TaxID=2817752 RepID=UPI002856F7DC|nr:ABC transporter substrate-binding protein [Ancylobacter sp. 3268]MDR6951538.1 multiple sugar transport system substrate-binding protein [Ancylobacter sp. 3268]